MYCQCALDYWEEDDDPIQEHIRNESTYCYFLDLYNNEQDGDKDNLELENPTTKSINDIDHEEGILITILIIIMIIIIMILMMTRKLSN